MSAYTRTTYHGRTFNMRTVAMLKQMESQLGYDLDIMQGSYSTTNRSSAGTHNGGGAVDLAPHDWDRKVHVGRQVGFAIWHRPALAGEWPEHVHGIAIGDKQMSDSARRQIQDYYAGLSGLASHGRDSTWHPNPIVKFQYPLLPVSLAHVHEQAVHPTHSLPGVKRVQKALNIKTGTHLPIDGKFGPNTKAAYGRYERQAGGDGNGIPEKFALTKLGLALYKVVP